MNRRLFIAGAAFAAAIGLSTVALAGANDYVFEPVKAEVKKGDNVTVAVRLVHKPTGKPVSDAVIVRTRIDMAPDGMAGMASPLTPVPSTEPGVYAFETEISMAGRWLFSIAARVQGEPEIVVGKVIFKATR
ncbi:MAG: FixH family protein [Xanthobacteraceae bacterium]|nr:FixH family protein [Xanthobacteraceae bacterium]